MPTPSIEALVAGLDQGGELGVEPGAWCFGRVHHAQVHRGQPVGAEGGEVVLDALAQLVRVVEAHQCATVVAAGGDLAHDRQARRVGVQRLPDELVDRAGTVVLGGVDVVYPGGDRRPQHPQRLVAIPRRPEVPVAGQLHRAVSGTVHAPRAEREGAAQRRLVAAHISSRIDGRRGHGWTCEPSPEIQAHRLEDRERGAGGERRHVRGGQHAGVLGDHRRGGRAVTSSR